jgi:excisionase family DNA binding protein
MTLRELADHLHCHFNTIYRLVERGETPGFKLGGSWRFLKSAVDKWIAGGSAEARRLGVK